MSVLPSMCHCCAEPFAARGSDDPWGGRLDAYCEDCAHCRCDAFPGACDDPGVTEVTDEMVDRAARVDHESECMGKVPWDERPEFHKAWHRDRARAMLVAALGSVQLSGAKVGSSPDDATGVGTQEPTS